VFYYFSFTTTIKIKGVEARAEDKVTLRAKNATSEVAELIMSLIAQPTVDLCPLRGISL
jgi:hypothetical protein